MNEAIKRSVIQDNPFKFIKTGNMTEKKVYLDMKEVCRMKKLEHPELKAALADI